LAFIDIVPVKEATGQVQEMYRKNQARLGYVPNYAKVFSLRPHIMEGWAQLQRSILSTMDKRRYELVTLAAARALRSSYCSLAHGTVLQEKFFRSEDLTTIALGKSDTPLQALDRDIMSFAEKVVREASQVTQEDVDRLRKHGLSDAEVLEIVTAAAARCFFSKTLDALGAEPDASYVALPDELRRALTVGRAISPEAVESIPADEEPSS
jgi:uncharacterized peroxidase-related enzyme